MLGKVCIVIVAVQATFVAVIWGILESFKAAAGPRT